LIRYHRLAFDSIADGQQQLIELAVERQKGLAIVGFGGAISRSSNRFPARFERFTWDLLSLAGRNGCEYSLRVVAMKSWRKSKAGEIGWPGKFFSP
jgi:hypothetical protein